LGLAVGKRLNDDLAVFTADLVAIWFALLWVESNRGNRKVVIASDSSSALLSIKNSHSGSRKDILLEILQLASGLQNAGLQIYMPRKQQGNTTLMLT